MNILLWILQVLLAFHTITGVFWKFSNSEQAVPSLAALPHAVWLTLAVLEFLCVLGLILPLFLKNKGKWAVFAALYITAEMLLFSVLHLFSAVTDISPLYYWLVVAVISAFIAYGRLVVKPLK